MYHLHAHLSYHFNISTFQDVNISTFVQVELPSTDLTRHRLYFHETRIDLLSPFLTFRTPLHVQTAANDRAHRFA